MAESYDNKWINDIIAKDRKYGASLVFLNKYKPSLEQIEKITQDPIEAKGLITSES